MPTISFHVPEDIGKKIRSAARKRGLPVSRFVKDAAEKEADRTRASFGAWADSAAGLVRSGAGDLSSREGFGE